MTAESSTRAGSYTNTFGYDLVGNPTTWKGATQTFNSVNQNTFGGTVSFDSNGNPQSWNSLALTWDANNKLVTVGSALTAGYGSDGLRAWKQSSAGRTYFLYDGLVPVCELDGSGNVTAFNTVGATGVLARHVNGTGGGSIFYAFDTQGSVALRLDTSGSIVSSHVNEAWGTQVSSGTGYSTDPYAGYGGQWGYYRDVETGLHLLGHRYYDAARGRFINRDPFGYTGGVNLYAYCRNNGVRRIDVTGYMPMTDPKGWVETRNPDIDTLPLGLGVCPASMSSLIGPGQFGLGSGAGWGIGEFSSGIGGGGFSEIAPGLYIPGEDFTTPENPIIMYHYSPVEDLHIIGIQPPVHLTDIPIHTYPDPWPFLESVGIGNRLPTVGYEVNCTGLEIHDIGTSNTGIGDFRVDVPIPPERVGFPIPLPEKHE